MVAQLNARPVSYLERGGIIERFFGVLEENSFHQCLIQQIVTYMIQDVRVQKKMQ